MLHRPAPRRPSRDRRDTTVSVVGISVEQLQRLIGEMVRSAVRDAVAQLYPSDGVPASFVAESPDEKPERD